MTRKLVWLRAEAHKRLRILAAQREKTMTGLLDELIPEVQDESN